MTSNHSDASSLVIVMIIDIFLWTYSLCTIILAVRLWINLVTDKQNYLPEIEPSKSVKVTAVLIPSVYCIIALVAASMGIVVYIHYDEFIYVGMDELSVINPESMSNTFLTAGIAIIMVHLLASIAFILFPIHLLSRIRNFFNKNKEMRRIFDEHGVIKYLYYFLIYILLLVQYCSMILLGIFASEAYTNTIFNQDIDHEDRTKLQIAMIVIMYGIDIIIHVILVWIYTQGLMKYAIFLFNHNYYLQYNDLNDKQHEIVLELTRYINVYGTKTLVTIICNLSIVCLLCIFIKMWYLSGAVIAIIVLITINDSVTMISLYLSFRWGHKIYESKHCCGRCDKPINSYIKSKILNQSSSHYENIKLQLAQPLLND